MEYRENKDTKKWSRESQKNKKLCTKIECLILNTYIMKEYRLKDEKFRKLAQQITGFKEGGSLPLEHFVSWEGSAMRSKLEEYGVFDLWFEEVQPEFKSGDYVVAVGAEQSDDKVRKIVECEVREDMLFWNECGKTREYFAHSWALSKIRHATAEEIEEYNQQLPTINGFEGRLEGEYIVYGCQSIHVQDMRRLFEACMYANVSSITKAGQEIKIGTLQEIYQKTC